MTQKTEAPRYLILAKILRPHGIRGELNVQIVTDFPERMKSLDQVYVGAENAAHLKAYQVEGARPQKKSTWLLQLNGIQDRDSAELLRNQFVFVSLNDAVPLENDEVYLFQVMGLQVETLQGQPLGRVVDIIETGANDVYVVQGSAYGEVLIPAVSGIILDIDVLAGVMKVDPPPGLLPDDSTE